MKKQAQQKKREKNEHAGNAEAAATDCGKANREGQTRGGGAGSQGVALGSS